MQQENQHGEPWNKGFDQSSQISQQIQPAAAGDPSRLPSENREEFERFQRSKDQTFLCMLVLVMIFLMASIVCGGVAVAMVPWWKHSTEVPEVSEVHIGLWEACFRHPGKDWECNKYTDSDTVNTRGNDTPHSLEMDILNSLSLAGIGVSFLALLLTIVAAVFKKSKYIRELLLSIGILCLIGAAFLGSVIGLVLDKNKAEDLVPSGIQLKASVTGKHTLKHALMFFIMCGAGGAVFMALVFTVVILFIHDDVDLNDMKYDNEQDEDLEMDENGFPVKESRRAGDQPGPSTRHLDVPDIGMANSEKRQKRRSQGSHDTQYSNPSFHPNYNMGYTHHHPHRPHSFASNGRPSSYYSDSSRNGHRPAKPPRSHHHPQQSRDHAAGGRRPRSNDFRSYEDYEMYFNTPY